MPDLARRVDPHRNTKPTTRQNTKPTTRQDGSKHAPVGEAHFRSSERIDATARIAAAAYEHTNTEEQ